MSGSEIENLVVAAEPAGIDETTEGLEDMEQQFDETADSFEETTDNFEGLQSKWLGAATAIVGGIATAVGGVLSQIPVVGESVGMLEGILQGLIFQIDQKLRPAFQDFNKDLAEVQREVFNAEGPIDAFIAAITGVGDAVRNLVAQGIANDIRDIANALLPFDDISGLQPVSEFIGDLATLQIGDIQGTLKNLNFGDIVDAWESNIQSLAESQNWDETLSAVGDAVDDLPVVQWGSDIVNNLVTGIQNKASALQTEAQNLFDTIEGKITNAVTDAKSWGRNVVENVIDGINNKMAALISRANDIKNNIADNVTDWNPIQWGKDLVGEIIDGIQNRASELGSAVENYISQTIRDRLPGSPAETGPLSDLDEVGPGLVDTVSTGMQQATGQLERASAETAGAMEPDGFGANRTKAPSIILDGREVSRGTSRYRDDGISRQGRFE